MYIYFDYELGTFIFTSRKKDGPRYIRIPEKEMLILAEKNINSIRKYILKHNITTSFFYYSTKELTRVTIPATYQVTNKSLYHKPQGLWLSCGTEWLDYIQANLNHAHKYNLFSYTYKIELYDTVKIITEKEQLFQFIKKYKRKADEIRLYDILDWDKIKADFTGLVITPHLGSKLWREAFDKMHISGAESAHDFFVDLIGPQWKNKQLLLCEWYRSWETASGVVWNASGIASFNLIKTTNYKKYMT